MNLYKQVLYGLFFFGILLILEDKFKTEGIYLLILSFIVLIIYNFNIVKNSNTL